MALLEIIQIPDPRLKKPSRKVNHIDDELRKIIHDMDETMCHHDGIGLAAVQVGLHKRICLVRIPMIEEEELNSDETVKILESEDEDAKKGIYIIEVQSDDDENDPDEDGEVEIPRVRYVRRKVVWPEARILVNPKVVEKEGAVIDDEGCLSDMGYQAKVERCRKIVIVAQDLDMNPVKIEASGLEARCLQHEIDHLDGIIYHDRMIEDTRETMKDDEDDEDDEDEGGDDPGEGKSDTKDDAGELDD